jgi:hypothetical protein
MPLKRHGGFKISTRTDDRFSLAEISINAKTALAGFHFSA